jgi:hypothetical protein
MNAGILPFLMICAAFGFAFYATPNREAWRAAAILAVSALVVQFLVSPVGIGDKVLFLGLWTVTASLAALVHLREGLRGGAGMIVALLAGTCLGMTVKTGEAWHLLLALPVALLFLPSSWLRSLGYGVAIKVMSSWLIAISLLAAMVSLTPTPGYQQDHME